MDKSPNGRFFDARHGHLTSEPDLIRLPKSTSSSFLSGVWMLAGPNGCRWDVMTVSVSLYDQ
jgi:hypothetical protein